MRNDKTGVRIVFQKILCVVLLMAVIAAGLFAVIYSQSGSKASDADGARTTTENIGDGIKLTTTAVSGDSVTAAVINATADSICE